MRVKYFLSLIILLLIGFFFSNFSDAEPLNNWHWRNPLPQGNPLKSIIYANNMFVSVGTEGTIITSPDGINWTIRERAVFGFYWLWDITYGKSIFVAVGSQGVVLTSSDGIHWTERSSPAYGLGGVTFGNNLFVAVGTMGTIITSPNGINWTKRNSGVSIPKNHYFTLNSVIYANNIFVAVGSIQDLYGHDTEVILTSTDGINWVRQDLGFSTYSSLQKITYGNGTFVVVGEHGTILTSSNGINWVQRNSGVYNQLNGITYGNNIFIAVGCSGTIITSSDGINWVESVSETTFDLNGITWGNNSFISVGELGFILSSTDGLSWEETSYGSRKTLNAAAYGNNIFVVVGDFDPILTSTNGLNWRNINIETQFVSLRGVTFGDNKFIAVGDKILVSQDGENWTILPPQSTGNYHYLNLNCVTYGNGKFIAVGSDGVIFTSIDGYYWTEENSGDFNRLNGVTYGGGIFVAVGENGTILTSPDGINWTKRFSGTDANLISAAYGSNIFVVTGGDDGVSLISNDGINWTKKSIGMLYGITFAAGRFVAVGFDWGDLGIVRTSEDGVRWDYIVPYCDFLYGVTYGNNTFIVVGEYGTILQSDPVGSAIKGISITPFEDFNSVGFQGGSFWPLSKEYIIRNNRSIAINYTASKSQEWLTLSKTGGSLSPGASDQIIVSINSNANSLLPGSYLDEIIFTDITYGDQIKTNVNLTVKAPILLSPNEGTIGTEILITGSGFGIKKGKVLIGTTPLTILEWKDDSIKCQLAKVISLGVYDLTILIAESKESVQLYNAFTVKGAEIESIEPNTGTFNDQITIKGKFFGTKKGKVSLEYEEGGTTIRKNCKVLTWMMHPATGDSEVVFFVPKMLPKVCDLILDAYGIIPEVEEDDAFTVMAPEIEEVEPASAGIGDQVTIKGNYFGKVKGKVYLSYISQGKLIKKNCSVLSWGDDEVVFVVPNIPPGNYDLIVVNSVGSVTWGQKFVIE